MRTECNAIGRQRYLNYLKRERWTRRCVYVCVLFKSIGQKHDEHNNNNYNIINIMIYAHFD